MRTLNRKLGRDLRSLRGQAIAIGVVIAAGIATYIAFAANLDTLRTTQEQFYEDNRFAEVFAPVQRAPDRLADQLRAISGVGHVETRITYPVRMDVPAFDEPVMGQIVSIPDGEQPGLNQIFLRQGRLPDPERGQEVVLGDAFADAHDLGPGDTLDTVIHGQLETLLVVGVGVSPDFIYQVGPDMVFPDQERFGLLWMNRSALGNATDLAGAWNEATLTLRPGANPLEVIERIDLLLEPYGSIGAYEREDQASHRFLNEEFEQLEQLTAMLPVIFLGVAVFLLNVVVTRLISTEREQIATLKAFGYTNREVGAHYLKLVGLIVMLGAVAGIGLGIVLGHALSDIYMEYFRFPQMDFTLAPRTAAVAVGISLLGAALGTLRAVHRGVSVPPAQAMQPEPPPVFRATLVERLGLQRFFTQPTRMILRGLERKPARTLLSITGIALACAVMILGTFFLGSINYFVDAEFRVARQDNLVVSFTDAVESKALYEVQSIIGVSYAEGFRSVPVRFRNEHRTYQTQIEGLVPDGRLRHLMDDQRKKISIPTEGLLLTEFLGEALGVKVGDILTVEVLEGRQPVVQVPVAGIVSQYIGVGAYMDRAALNAVLGEGALISGASVAIDRGQNLQVYQTLRNMPGVAGIASIDEAVANFYDTMGQVLIIYMLFSAGLAAAIAVGVVYNNARIALAERSREMASLRVLGFTRGEISYILLGELALLTLMAIPLGFLLGYGLAAVMVQGFESELFRMPLVIERRAYTMAAVVVLVSAILSGLIVRHRLDHLDLVGVLKTRE